MAVIVSATGVASAVITAVLSALFSATVAVVGCPVNTGALLGGSSLSLTFTVAELPEPTV